MVYLSDGSTRCCGSAYDVVRVREIHPDSLVEKVLLPPTPDTVDIQAQNMGFEMSLPQSDLEPFIPTLHD